MLVKECSNTVLETQTCLHPVFPGGRRVQLWFGRLSSTLKSSGFHPVVTDLKDLTFISKFA